MRVRSRLVAAVAVVAVAVLGAGAPAVVTASGDLTDSQRLVALAELNDRAVVLAHSLADERDTMTEYVSSGRRATGAGAGVSESRRARVDREIKEMRPDAPADLRRLFGELPKARQQALAGPGSALDTYNAYTESVQALHGVSRDLARKLPARASGGPGVALPALGRAVEQASASRGLLLSALPAGGSQQELTSAAQRSRVQEEAALAEFKQVAPHDVSDAYARTVNGTEVTTAERYLDRLTDQPRLSGSDHALDEGRVEAVLSSRIERMRAVESSLTTAEITRLAQQRDNDVTALELRIGFVVLCLLFAIAISISAARSMTRPLSVLRRGARRVAEEPLTQEPVAFTGRNDEFADAVRAVNELQATAGRLQARADQLADDRSRLIDERRRLADDREGLLRQREDLTARLSGLQDRVHGTFVNLSQRSLGLVEVQLGILESMEESEQDPDRLDTLFRLDHLATRMRRHGENLLVLAGSDHAGSHGGPVPLLDVLRAGISEIERYERVQIQSLPPHAQVSGFAADAVSHLVAELLENATSFSPPEAHVELSGWLLENGEVMLSVQDHGIGLTADRLDELNVRLADPDSYVGGESGPDETLGLGLYVVSRLAARHGMRVNLREQRQGGVAAVIVLPTSILPTRPAPSVPGGGSAGSGLAPSSGLLHLPGSVAEANSNALSGRRRSPVDSPTTAAGAPTTEPQEAAVPPQGDHPYDRLARHAEHDPLVAAAERAVESAGGSGPAAEAPEDRYRIGREEHARPAESGPAGERDEPTRELLLPWNEQTRRPVDAPAPPETGAGERLPQREPAERPRTEKGLPKRTPKVVAPQGASARQAGGFDAEALRRRLGGFQQASRNGRRDAEAEATGDRGDDRTGTLDEGGTVEEARG